ncbi:glycosyltransferase family 4 protein [Acidobacteria bacterium AB60]|nr:glycosyltransferase family 4 protein [Acidobacteria bacterium AB60]
MNQRSLSILHLVLEPRFSGAEILVCDLVRIHQSQGHQTSIAAFRPSHLEFAPELRRLENLGCRTQIPSQNLVRWRRVQWVLAAVKRFQPDVVFAHSILPGLYARIALSCSRRPSVVTVLHSDDDLRNPRLLRLEQLLWWRNACVVGVSRKSVENYRNRVTSKARCRVISNGISPERFAGHLDRSREVRTRLYGASDDVIIALQVGRICLQKQQLASVQALAVLSRRGIRNLRIVMAGPIEDRDYAARLIDLAREAGVLDQIQLVGSQANVEEWLAGADLFLMPSGWEAHSVAALEGMASGLPCVFSGIDAFEAWRGWPGVFMIEAPPVAEELATCLESLLRNQGWSHRYKRDLSKFSIARCAAEYLELARKLAPSGL